MERTVSTKKGDITYIFTKKQVKNVNMRIKPDGSVHVSASPRIPVKEIDGFVVEKADFIFQAWEKFEEVTQISPQKQNYVNGGTIYFLGEALTLVVSQGTPSFPTKKDNTLVFTAQFPDNTLEVQQLVYQFYNKECVKIFVALMEQYQQRLAELNIPQASLKIRDMKSRWGTCHTGKKVITLNSKLIFTPYSSIEYVVLHEFCHFIHPNHSREFYNLVARYMPNWKVEREELKRWSCRD